jgi:hypothetical protein
MRFDKRGANRVVFARGVMYAVSMHFFKQKWLKKRMKIA